MTAVGYLGLTHPCLFVLKIPLGGKEGEGEDAASGVGEQRAWGAEYRFSVARNQTCVGNRAGGTLCLLVQLVGILAGRMPESPC